MAVCAWTKRERLKELQRAGRWPKVKSVRQSDVVAALTKLRDLLQDEVGVAAPGLKALVGNVIIESRQVEGESGPGLIARFTINAMPAMAMLGCRSRPSNSESVWPYIQGDNLAKADRPSRSGEVTNSLAYKPGGGQRRSDADGTWKADGASGPSAGSAAA